MIKIHWWIIQCVLPPLRFCPLVSLANKWYSTVLKHFICMTSLTLNPAFAVWTVCLFFHVGGGGDDVIHHDSVFDNRSIFSSHFPHLFTLYEGFFYASPVDNASSTQLKLKSVFFSPRGIHLQTLQIATSGMRVRPADRRGAHTEENLSKAWKPPGR